MIKVEKISDIEELNKENINSLFAVYIQQYLQFFLNEYHCQNMSQFGAFYILNDKTDICKYKEMGLQKPIEESLSEFTEELIIKNSIEEIKILHSCFVLNDSYAISVFVQRGLLDFETEEYLFPKQKQKTIMI